MFCNVLSFIPSELHGIVFWITEIMASKLSDACYCRNLTLGIVFLTIGTLSVVAGGIIAAVGFGTRPKDMFDTQNL